MSGRQGLGGSGQPDQLKRPAWQLKSPARPPARPRLPPVRIAQIPRPTREPCALEWSPPRMERTPSFTPTTRTLPSLHTPPG